MVGKRRSEIVVNVDSENLQGDKKAEVIVIEEEDPVIINNA